MTGIEQAAAVRNYLKALGKGVMKVMSKMRISTVASYTAAGAFEAIGLDRAVIDEYFTGTSSQIGGVGLDVGCGTGRWSVLVAPRVAHLHLLDPSSEALDVAKQNLRHINNVSYHLHSVAAIPLPPRSLDFAFSLGVLHHVPDTQAAIAAIAVSATMSRP